LAWLALKQKKYNEALEIIEKNKEVISVKKNTYSASFFEVPDTCSVEAE
jgi:hypothetical protein